MKSREVQDKALEKILQALIDKIALLCPVHQIRIEFLKEKRNNSFLTDFLQRLEERIEFLEFETLTKESLLIPIFLSKATMSFKGSTNCWLKFLKEILMS